MFAAPTTMPDIVLKSEISLLTGLAVMFTFIACGVRMALVWGVMTFLLNFIPNVGSMMALVAPLPVRMICAD
jgi:AI-2 transport protein TqsA